MAIRLQDVATSNPSWPHLEVGVEATGSSPSTFFHLQRQPPATYFKAPLPGSYNRVTPSTMLHQSGVPRAQSVGWRESSNRSLRPQQTYQIKNLQNARHFKDPKRCPTPGSLHVHRSVGCFLPHSSSPTVPEIPLLHRQRKTLHVPSNALRHQIGTTDLHQSDHGGTKATPQSPHRRVCLHRRLAPLEHVRISTNNKHLHHLVSSHEPRIHDQLGEISTPAAPLNNLPRGHMERSKLHHCAEPKKHRQSYIGGYQPFSQPTPDQEKLSEISRVNQLHSPVHHTGSLSAPSGHPGGSKISPLSLPPTTTRPAHSHSMVDKTKKSPQPNSHCQTSSTTHSLDRRIPFWLGGSLLPRNFSMGGMATRRPTPTHQPPRGKGSLPLPSSPLSRERYITDDQDGQHGGSLSPQQAGIQQNTCSQPHPPASAPPLCRKRMDSPSPSHPGTSEHVGGLPLEESRHPLRVDPHPELLQSHPTETPPGDRSLRTSRQHETESLRLPISPPDGNNHGRPLRRLEPVEDNLSIPSNRSNTDLSSQTRLIRGKWRRHRPLSSYSSMVARSYDPLRTIRRRARNLPTCSRPTAMGTARDVINLSRIQFLTKIFKQRFPSPVVQSLISSTRSSTNSQYETCWKHFQSWLARQVKPKVSKGTILLYLQELSSSRHLNPKTILVYRNSLHLPLLYGFHISTKDREFSLLARSQFIANPPQQRFVPTWNPSAVLSMLEQPRFDVQSSSPADLLSKTLFLTALATGNRVSELAAMSRHSSSFVINDTQVVIPIRPGFLYKNQSMARTPPNIVIPALLHPNKSHHALCPVKALKRWLQVSAPWGSDSIFVNPHSKRPMNRGAISLQLVKTINSALPDVFAKAHDVRKISASLAWARGVSPQDITKFMFWTTSSVFIAKYLSPISDTQPCVVASHASS